MSNPSTFSRRAGPASPGPALTIVYRPIAALRPDPDNPRTHSRRQVRRLADSIASFGLNAPILVDGTLRVVAGHGRLLACRQLGWSEVPTITLAHLNGAAARAFMIADNRIAETAGWDDRALRRQLTELSLAPLDFDIAAIGFTAGEIALRIEMGHIETERNETGAGRRARREGRVEPAAPAGARPGDLWLLGRHRLYCGDDAAAARALLRETDRVVVFALDPTAADAIIARWQALTGETARRAATGCRGDAAGGR